MYFICYYVYLWWSVLFLHIFYEVFSQCWYHFISFFNSFNTAFRLIKPPLEITDIILLHVRHLQGLRYAQCVCLCVQVDYNFNHEPVSLCWCDECLYLLEFTSEFRQCLNNVSERNTRYVPRCCLSTDIRSTQRFQPVRVMSF